MLPLHQGATTLDQKLLLANNRPTGFDYMRNLLALFVFVSHTINVCYGQEFTKQFWSGSLRPIIAFILPMFFALSGFLVAASLLRCKTLISFLGLRVLRILPALLVEVTLSALVLGALFTTLPLNEYFTHTTFYKYFLNILGIVHMQLPGVFVDNPWRLHVNEQLWTLPWEFRCYALLAVIAAIGFVSKKWRFLSIVLVLNIGFAAWYLLGQGAPKNPILVNGWILVLCFLFGVLFALFRDQIVYDHRLGITSIFASMLGFALPGCDPLTVLPITYATVYLGLMNPPRLAVLYKGDYSYGLFLYGFAIQQAVAAQGPTFQVWWMNLLVALPLTLSLAIFSWHLIEKPFLNFRPALMALENRWLSKKA